MKKALSLALAAAMAASLAACRRFSRCIYGQLRCNNGHRSFRRRFCRRPDPEGHAV